MALSLEQHRSVEAVVQRTVLILNVIMAPPTGLIMVLDVGRETKSAAVHWVEFVLL